MKFFFNPKRFLQVGGAFFLIVGILGFVGVIGPTAQKSIFHAAWYFDTSENWAYTVLGLVSLAASVILTKNLQKNLVLLLSVVGFIVGLYGFLVSPIFLGANLENPRDIILSLVIGVWAIYSAMNSVHKQ